VHNNDPVPQWSGKAAEIGWSRAVLGHSYLVFWAAKRLGYADWVNSWGAHYRIATAPGTGVDVSCRLLQRLQAQGGREGFRLLFVMQYGAGDFDSPEPPAQAAAVLACARAHGIEAVDTWPLLQAVHRGDRERFRRLYVLYRDGRTLGHMSAEGNRLVAGALADALRRSGP
jgi:hypothetical protein